MSQSSAPPPVPGNTHESTNRSPDALDRAEADLQALAGRLAETEWRVDEYRQAAELAVAERTELSAELTELRDSLAESRSDADQSASINLAQAEHIARLKKQTERPVRLLSKKVLRTVDPRRRKP